MAFARPRSWLVPVVICLCVEPGLQEEVQEVSPGGACLLQKSNSVRKVSHMPSHLEPPASGVAATSPGNKSIVALTFCDSGFRQIWPTFYKCFLRATTCAGSGPCSMPDVQLVDLGMEENAATGEHCMRTSSLLQNAATSALPPNGVPPIIMSGILRVLSQGQDLFRIDADAFLLRNPFDLVQGTHPDAHIISSADIPGDWYREELYEAAHGGADPIGKKGFMLNTGLMYVRSTPLTIEVSQLAVELLGTVTTNEQIAFNEALLKYSCQWTMQDGQPMPEDKSFTQSRLNTEVIYADCDKGLRVVVLPFSVITRSDMDWSDQVAFHPGGPESYKFDSLPHADAACSAALPA